MRSAQSGAVGDVRGVLCLLVRDGPSARAEYTEARHYATGQVARYTYIERDAGWPAELTAVAQLRSFSQGRRTGRSCVGSH